MSMASIEPDVVGATTSGTSLGDAVAVDIECIPLVSDPDYEFQDPTHWSTFCIPVAHHDDESDSVESAVLVREGATLRDEMQLLEEFVEWVRARSPTTLITYNGSSYDLPILKHRASTVAHEVPGDHSVGMDVEILCKALDHRDLFTEVKADAGYNVPLESALEFHDINTVETKLNGREITGADMPRLGLRILSGRASENEIRAVNRYAESDVAPLFELAGKLD